MYVVTGSNVNLEREEVAEEISYFFIVALSHSA